MKVQRARRPDTLELTWIVLDDQFFPVEPIRQFIEYLETLERSPNTIRGRAYHLKLYWQYLADNELDWQHVDLLKLSRFIRWLRQPDPRVVSLQPVESKRTESTVNQVMTSVCLFYEFHIQMEHLAPLPLHCAIFQPYRRYKPLLHHLSRGKRTLVRRLKLKEPEQEIKTLTPEQVTQLIDACRRIRDKLLVCLLYESGLRIGQALGLKHQDIRSWNNEIQVVPRDDNPNGARAKCKHSYTVQVTKELMELYTDYCLKEFGETDSEYVFVNLWEGSIGAPLTYNAAIDLFRRLGKKTRIPVTPHQLRHSHGSDMAANGADASIVQKRLGHKNVQTTQRYYIHVSNQQLKEAHKDYVAKRNRHTPDSSLT